MEPMTLGSPTHSPSGSPIISYMPPFLMGEINAPTTPRTNSLSPTKGRNLAFGSPTNSIQTSTPDKGPKQSMLMKQQAVYNQHQNQSIYNNVPQSPNISFSNKPNGPPTQGLFDSLQKNDRPYSNVQSFQDGNISQNNTIQNSYLGQNNVSITNSVNNGNQSANASWWQDNCAGEEENWITVFGFPPSAASMVLAHLSHCGTILDKQYPTQGNWAHVRFSTRVEKARAISLNGRQLTPGIMVGVISCKDPPHVQQSPNTTFASERRHTTARPLCPTAVPTVAVPQRTNGIVAKAMELVFGW